MKINVIGIGPGSLDYLLPVANVAINECDIIIGGKRNLQIFEHLSKEFYEFGSDLEGLYRYINSNHEAKKVGVVVSGDPGFYSLLRFLAKRFGKEKLNVIPGISSFQYLYAKIGKPWQQHLIASIHGREFDMIKNLKDYKGMFLLTDEKNSPSAIAKTLIEHGFGSCSMTVGENLSYVEEQILAGKPEIFVDKLFDSLSVVVIEKDGMEI